VSHDVVADRRLSLRKGAREGVPVAISFFGLFFAVGVASEAARIPGLHCMLLSLLVYAAPAQLAIAELVRSGQEGVAIVVITLVINFRFAVLASTLLPYFRGTSRGFLALGAQTLGATTFAVGFMEARRENATDIFAYYAGVSIVSYPVALMGTGLGYCVGSALPPIFNETVAMILPIYFTASLADEWPKARPLIAGLLGVVLTPLVARYNMVLGLVCIPIVVGLALAALPARSTQPGATK